ncbi:MAG TPA: hypothetical protein VI072_10600 [Polyangiaceae bacterium]
MRKRAGTVLISLALTAACGTDEHLAAANGGVAGCAHTGSEAGRGNEERDASVSDAPTDVHEAGPADASSEGRACFPEYISEPECGSPGSVLVSVENRDIPTSRQPSVREAEIRRGEGGVVAVLTARATGLCDPQADQCANGQRTLMVGPIELTPEDLRILNALLVAFSDERCSPSPMNPNCDHFYPTRLWANGTAYTNDRCRLRPCWTDDMAAVIDFIDVVVAREF